MIAIHVGCGSDSFTHQPEVKRVMKKVVLECTNQIKNDHESLDVCTHAISMLEDSALFNCGSGSSLNSCGEVEMESALMCGFSKQFAGVSSVCCIKNPIQLSRNMISQRSICNNQQFSFSPQFIAGRIETERMARLMNIAICENTDLISYKASKEHKKLKEITGIGDSFSSQYPLETVGAIVYDKNGHISVAGSTGGAAMKQPGRIGHISLPNGSGCWANDDAAACATGVGDFIGRSSLCRSVVNFLLNAPLEDTVQCEEMIKFYSKFIEENSFVSSFPFSLVGILSVNKIRKDNDRNSIVVSWIHNTCAMPVGIGSIYERKPSIYLSQRASSTGEKSVQYPPLVQQYVMDMNK